ncbi:fumarylacetoacetate hydrolase family protein [Tengunoibacter tsumagoiensis]|uniref:Fumarylacetoacetase-like C-terminal domain-containing protein n=1 Tax=Tengunoibacter tsumagoiensis TaxID=2014871 RepID=A0A402A3T2_9CHLR|nr:fumarylacetoacetate hydrolase family protein [Tengunoibacter tsumagoiensis]GCE13804.1 hypothetical protein KTT_36630 [Tengunoibacter tsumagoiensis]
MRLITYRTAPDAPWQAGFELEGRIIAASAVYLYGEQAPTVKTLLEAGQAALEKVLAHAHQLFEASEQEFASVDEVELGAPIPDPDKIICVGLNYADHAEESQLAIPQVPVLFPKYRNSLTGPFSQIILPGFSTEIDYEAELAVIIGQTCKDVSEAEALQYVAGYTIMNDVSARDWQMRTSQWMPGKAIDTFGPMGPGIVPASEIQNPQQLRVWTRINGETVQNGTTEQMIFSVARCIAFISTFMTLVPGDIISTGTPAGVGFARKPPIYLKAGDLVEVEIERVGTIRNPVVSREY